MDKRLSSFKKAIDHQFPQLTASLLSEEETKIVRENYMSGDIERIRNMIQPMDIKKCMGDGWISPDGLFYAVRPEGHIEMAGYFQELGIIPDTGGLYDAEDWMDNHNWLKLSRDEFRLYCNNKLLVPTEVQMRIIEDYSFCKKGPGMIKFNGYEFADMDSFREMLEERKGMI